MLRQAETGRDVTETSDLRRTRADEAPVILEIINAAAERYRGAIPDDCWHEPYMSADELERECAAGVAFWGVEDAGTLIGVMGVQDVKHVQLIRHAYVRPQAQGQGVGTRLLDHFVGLAAKPVLIGTWADAVWAIGFYERHGFALAPREATPDLLRAYWNVPARQAEVSVVLRQV
ncbi:MAG: GNAT family N-acetyltransferase [Phenylobacterium sp.]